MATFSVIIPIYNTAKYLGEAIESVLAQTFTDFEVILVDDGSTDDSPRIADEFAQKDSRVRVMHQENFGVACARNNGVAEAKCDYLVFLDSDDVFCTNDALEKIHKRIVERNADVVEYGYWDLNLITGKKLKTHQDYDEEAFCGDKNTCLNYIYDHALFPAACWLMAVRRKVVVDNGIRFPENVICEDVDWGVKILYFGQTISFVDDCLVTYRRNREGSIMYRVGRRHIEGCLVAINNWMHVPEDVRYLGLTNFLAHLYGYITKFYIDIPKEKQHNVAVDMKASVGILKVSDKWNHHLIYYTIKVMGLTFTSHMIQIVYRIFYAPGVPLRKLRKKLQLMNH